MNLIKNNYIKIIRVFTILCFIIITILKVFNMFQIDNYYFYIFIIMIFLMFIQFPIGKDEASMKKKIYFWVTLFVWGLISVVYIFFNISRYVIKLLK